MDLTLRGDANRMPPEFGTLMQQHVTGSDPRAITSEPWAPQSPAFEKRPYARSVGAVEGCGCTEKLRGEQALTSAARLGGNMGFVHLPRGTTNLLMPN